MTTKLTVEVWSDIACPWCYVGKRRLEQALAQFEHADAVQVVWRAFELDKAAPAVREPVPYAERLAKKYGGGVAQAQAMIDRMVGVAKVDGLQFDFTAIRPGNTFDAHRLLHLAARQGLQGALKERLFRAYLSEGLAIGERAVLRGLAAEVGLDADEVEGLLAGDLFADEVRDEEREASSIGIEGVPFFLIGRRYAVAGAQTSELLLGALRQCWQEQLEEGSEGLTNASGAVCGPTGCD
jgi:predicted DsbA family dithiol-disulfide isomerase